MRGAAIAFVLMIGCAGFREARAEPFPKGAENLLKWGEFDSLALILEPWLNHSGQAGNGEDSAYKAKANLYLGVAYSTLGKAFVADQAFLRAFRFDPRIHPDKFYVSKTIADRFETIAEEERKRILVRKRESAQRDSAARAYAAAPPAPFSPDSPGEKPKSAALGRRRATWIWWTVGVAGIATAGVVGYLFLLQEPEKKPDTETTLPVE